MNIGESFAYHLTNFDDFDYFDVTYPFLLEEGAEFYFNSSKYKVLNWQFLPEKERVDELEDIYIQVNCVQLHNNLTDKPIYRTLKLNNLLK